MTDTVKAVADALHPWFVNVITDERVRNRGTEEAASARAIAAYESNPPEWLRGVLGIAATASMDRLSLSSVPEHVRKAVGL